MNITEFLTLINNPNAINDKQTSSLEKIVAEFPYFQSARALRLKGLYNEESFRYNYELKIQQHTLVIDQFYSILSFLTLLQELIKIYMSKN